MHPVQPINSIYQYYWKTKKSKHKQRYHEGISIIQWNLVITRSLGPWILPCYIRVKKRNIKNWDQQNYLVRWGFCYIRPLYNEVPLYLWLWPPPRYFGNIYWCLLMGQSMGLGQKHCNVHVMEVRGSSITEDQIIFWLLFYGVNMTLSYNNHTRFTW